MPGWASNRTREDAWAVVGTREPLIRLALLDATMGKKGFTHPEKLIFICSCAKTK